MTTHSDDDLPERREPMRDILGSWDLEGALPDAAAMQLIRQYVAGSFGPDELIQKMANPPAPGADGLTTAKFIDPYLYPGTEVLKNIPGIRDPRAASRFERCETLVRRRELEREPVQGTFDLEHLREIHRRLY